MKYRIDKKKTLKELSFQPEIVQNQKLPVDGRTDWLSLLLLIPLEDAMELSRNAIDLIRHWDPHLYYLQRGETQHITFLEFGEINLLKVSLKDINSNLKKFLATSQVKKISVTLTEAQICRTGINCMFDYDEKVLDRWIDDLSESLLLGPATPLSHRSIIFIIYFGQ